MVVDRGLLSTSESNGTTTDACPAGVRGDLLDSASWCALARSAGGVRRLGDRVCPLQSLVVRRNAGRGLRPLEKAIQSRGAVRPFSVVDRWQRGSCPSVCWWGWKKGDPREPDDHALGRSRGGFSTKIHVICDGEGRPLNFELSPGQTHETQRFDDLWNSTEVLDHKRNYLIQPDALAGDKAYYSFAIARRLEADGVTPVIPKIGASVNAQGGSFDRESYRRRNVIERLIGWLKESRRVFARFEKTAINYLGMIHTASIRFYLAELT